MSRPNGEKAFLSILMVLTLVFSPLVVQPVGAVEPQFETFHNEGTLIAAECDGFLAIADFVLDQKVTTFFDNEGNPVGAQVHFHNQGTLTNSVTGVSLRDHWEANVFVDFAEGTLAGTGQAYAITVPGEGVAVFSVGRVVFDADGNLIFSAGPTDFLEAEALICQALD